MRETMGLKVPKWPFFLGDAVMLGLSYFVYWQGTGPLTHWDVTAICICTGLGALLGVLPFLLEYRALLRLVQLGALGTVAEKIANLERVAALISGATNQWDLAQQHAEKTADTAREISERMAAEVRDFTGFMERINEGEKATLRLEAEKLRRGENEWLQIVVRILDHVFALHTAAARSGQAGLLDQLTLFQNACRDAAHRAGLAPFVAQAGEPFDPERHQWADGETPGPDAAVTETVATGFTFQGRQIRPALVRAQTGGLKAPQPQETESAGQTDQSQLPLPSA